MTTSPQYDINKPGQCYGEMLLEGPFFRQRIKHELWLSWQC